MIPDTLGAFIAGCAGTTLLSEERAFFARTQPFAFILFARNIDTPDQIRALCSDLRDSVGWNAPILIDQEGGRVARLRPPLARDWLAPLDEAARAGDRAAEVFHLRYRIIAAELRALGIDGNCAPCADVMRPDTHEILLNRCYGDTPARVGELGRAVSDGLLAGGVLPVLKHIPGHGAATADSHLELPRVDLAEDILRATDFAPFAELADIPMGMTAHVVYAAIDPDLCATVSPRMIDLMRSDLGFNGLLMSDDISMQALSGTIHSRSHAAIAAGCDVVLHCNGDMAEMEEVAEAAGPMTAAAHARAARVIAMRAEDAAGDLDALSAQWEALIAGLSGDG